MTGGAEALADPAAVFLGAFFFQVGFFPSKVQALYQDFSQQGGGGRGTVEKIEYKTRSRKKIETILTKENFLILGKIVLLFFKI